MLPASLPDWSAEEDLDFFVQEMITAGFTGGFNWYRNINRMPGLLAPFIGKKISQPALYLYGEHDLISGNTPRNLATMQEHLSDLRGCTQFEGAGHWLQ